MLANSYLFYLCINFYFLTHPNLCAVCYCQEINEPIIMVKLLSLKYGAVYNKIINLIILRIGLF